MNTRKNMTLPIILSFIFLIIIVYLFANIKQTKVVCEKTKIFDSNIKIVENVVSTMDGKGISSMKVTKTIILPDKYLKDDHYLNGIKNALENTLEYLGDKAKIIVSDDRVIVNIEVDKNEVLMLDNIEFVVNDDLEIKINTNTKSSDAIVLSVGDNYTDGELMKRLKNNGYTCK